MARDKDEALDRSVSERLKNLDGATAVVLRTLVDRYGQLDATSETETDTMLALRLHSQAESFARVIGALVSDERWLAEIEYHEIRGGLAFRALSDVGAN